MRVLFIIPKLPGRFAGPDFPHVGIGYLTSILLEHGIEVSILDLRLGGDAGKILSVLRAFKPNLVGVTSTSYGYKKAYDIVDIVKSSEEVKEGCRVVIGGPHVSALGSRVLDESGAHFAVEGEGEFTLLELSRALEEGRGDFGDIKGLIWRWKGQTVENADRSFIMDLDALPFPAYERFDLERYFCYQERILPLVTSRGCPFRCTYCSVRLSMGPKFRPRTPENTVDELEYWSKRGWSNFDFYDDNFSCHMERAEKICDLILTRGLKIRWRLNNGVRVDRVTSHLLKKMEEAGCVLIAFGIESGNEEVLRRIRKSTPLQQIRQVVEMADEVGIEKKIGYFIVGPPGETYDKFMDSVRLAQSLPLDEVNFYNLVPYPGTELFQWVKENGHLLCPEEVYLNQISYWQGSPIFETEEFPARERKRALKIGHSLERKSMAQTRFGRFWGYWAWLLTAIPLVERFAIWLAKESRLGRSLFLSISSRLKRLEMGRGYVQ